MKTILQINSSLSSGEGHSSRLADQYVAARAARFPGLKLVKRDLGRHPVPHLDGERFAAFTAKPEARNVRQSGIVAFSDLLIEELRSADELVIGLPMYNFGVPSTLKAWIDHVARAGETFRYTAHGAEGLLKGKRATVFAARGGAYVGTPLDTQTKYVRDVLGFLGITDVKFVYAENLAISDESRSSALEQARAEIARLAPPMQVAA